MILASCARWYRQTASRGCRTRHNPHHTQAHSRILHGIKAAFGQVALHFACGRPPVVMVAFQQPFLARQVWINAKSVSVHSSFMAQRVSPRQNDGILRGNHRAPVCFQLGQIAFPAFKNIHRLIPPRKVKSPTTKLPWRTPGSITRCILPILIEPGKGKLFCALSERRSTMMEENVINGICCDVENCVYNNGSCCCTA